MAKKQWVEVNVSDQTLQLKNTKRVIASYPVSTSRHGVGQTKGSFKTPLGKHEVIEKVGAGKPWNALFKYGEFTGKYYKKGMVTPNGDPILTRIIRLSGLQSGVNAGGEVDTEERRIYIHGTPPSEHPRAQKPKSRGCIRMHPQDIIDLYPRIDVGTLVVIKEK